MLTRRYLRMKVLQELYAFSRNTDNEYGKAEKGLLKNISKVYDLYIYQLSFIAEISDFARQRIEDARNKFYPTHEDLNPNLKFVNNRLLQQLKDNRSYNTHRERLRINWSEEQDVVRKFYNRLRESKVYKDYMNDNKDSYIHDKDFLIHCVRNVLADDELLQSYYEDKYVYWVNDFDATLIMLEKTFRLFKSGQDTYTPLPSLYSAPYDENNRNDDQEFIKRLFHSVIANDTLYDEIITERTDNWDFDRIALMDILIIKMAISEFTEFETIPTKVTMNEYIELSKVFSTPKSHVFVNGMLDKILNVLTEQGKVKKIGRGLINN